jgi:hypothetical protein
MAVPDGKLEATEARNTAMAAWSCCVPQRPAGVRALMRSCNPGKANNRYLVEKWEPYVIKENKLMKVAGV